MEVVPVSTADIRYFGGTRVFYISAVKGNLVWPDIRGVVVKRDTGDAGEDRRMQRSGITPLVAIVMLLFIVIVAVSGFAMFVDQFLDDQWENIQRQAGTQVEFRHLACNDQGPDQSGTIDFLIKNTGQTNIDTAAVDIYVRSVSDGSLVDAISTGGGEDLGPGDHWPDSVTLGGNDFSAGRAYIIEFEFASAGGTSTAAQCVARR